MSGPFLYTVEGLDGEELDVAGVFENGTKNRPTREDPGYGTPPEIIIEELIDTVTGQDVKLTRPLEYHLLDLLEDLICRDNPEA